LREGRIAIVIDLIDSWLLIDMVTLVVIHDRKVGCLHPVACTRSGSGFSSNATLV
jgi:hypothetical protein